MGDVRIGYVSSYDAASGMAAVYYPDRCKEVTDLMPVFTPFGLLQKLKKDDMVLVLHLSNDSSTGIVIGGYSSNGDTPDAWIECSGGSLVLHDKAGSISIAELMDMKRMAHEKGE